MPVYSRDYDLSSLRHERKMLALYRRRSSTDPSLLQPLANACCRASAFAWVLEGEPETVRELWGEAARCLAHGFVRRPAGFDRSPDQLMLALYLAIAARAREAFTTLAFLDADWQRGALREARAFRHSRAHLHLAEGFALLARALAEKRAGAAARSAVEALHAARLENDRGWWERQFPDPLEAAWRADEHDSVCLLLGLIAERIMADPLVSTPHSPHREPTGPDTVRFAVAVDQALERLVKFVETDINHHPKLYLWLPGIALCALAASAGFPTTWLEERDAARVRGYERLPLALIRNASPQL